MAVAIYTHTVTASAAPLDGALVRVTTDSAGTNVVASGYSDAFGHAIFSLDEGDYFIFCQRAGTDFANPTAETVVAPTSAGSTDGTPAAGGTYATAAEYKASQGIADTADDAVILRALQAATEWIDGHCGRTFGMTAAETREFYPLDGDQVLLPDLVAATTVKLDTNGDGTYDTTLSGTKDYEVLPLNAATQGPGTLLRLRPTASVALSPARRVQVDGTWGYGSVPQSVTLACILLAARYFTRKNAPFSVVQAPETGFIARIPAQDPDVLNLLERYVSRAASNSWVVV